MPHSEEIKCWELEDVARFWELVSKSVKVMKKVQLLFNEYSAYSKELSSLFDKYS